jgi:Helicase conserved C-terminal domain
MTRQTEPAIEHQRALADHLVGAIVHDGSGEADGDLCIGEPPSARYYLAALAPSDLDLAAGRERRGRQTPGSLGFEFEVVDDRATLDVRATVSCYYRVLPTLEEQLVFAGGDEAPSDRAGRDYRMAPVYRRVGVDTGTVTLRLDPDRHLQHTCEEEFAAAFRAACDAAAADPRVERREGDDRKERFVPGDALMSEDAFLAWLAALPGVPVVPHWTARVTALTRPVGDGRFRVALSVDNLSNDPVVTRRVRGENVQRHDDARDHFLFRVCLEVGAAPGVIVPVETYLGPDAYRYDPNLAAYANSCGVETEHDPSGSIVRLRSAAAPAHETRRMVSKDHPATSFAGLADDPIPLLDSVVSDMRTWMASEAWSTSGLREELAERKEADRLAFGDEIARFEDGVRWLGRDERLLLAFKLANRTMLRLGEMTGKRHAGWHLFQLVFIVSQLPALAWREHNPAEFTPGLWGGADDPDPTSAATVLFFATSGGKTEAYLGLIACAMFYDRARGKSRGVTAWCRFPLRLLTLQQTQRQVNFVVAAEETRSASVALLEDVGGSAGDPFALGFFAGEGNTPNSLSRDQAVLDRLITDPERRREVRVVDECPYCRKRAVEVLPPDPSKLRLVHACRECGRELPVLVVDTEVYRYLPTLIVGTLDKLANIGLTDRFGALLGDIDCECSLHGYGRGGKCHERRAKGHPRAELTIVPADPPYDACPSLEIVDELHMVDEDLGAFSGHYEGILAVAQRRLSPRTRSDGRGVKMKVVATTATIKGEDRQVDHLFGLRSVVVPLPGPSLEESFYWRLTDRPLRRFVGIQPNRTTAEQALVRILQAFHQEIRGLEADGPARVAGLGSMNRDAFDALLDLYRVSLTYVTSLVDFGKLRRSMDTQVNEYLRRRQLPEVAVRELSGDTGFDDVRVTLDHLTDSGPTDGVIATSMVSHGVDVDRLNIMVFNGMPKSMAEYIQASSRVGRKYLGLVFMIFNPVRERDRSHFRYHGKFHEYLDRMVAPVAINRWSRYAARKTLPGVLMADILQVANRDFWDAGRAPAHLHDLTRMQEALRPLDAGGLESVRTEALLAALGDAYLTGRDEAVELRSELDDRVPAAVSSIRAAGAAASAALGGRPRYRGTGDYLGLDYTPMTSLRDIAEGIPFYVLPEKRRP